MTPYIMLCIFFSTIWLFLFFYKKNKQEQIAASVFGLLVTPFFMFLVHQDFFLPQYICSDCLIKVEDLIFSFMVSGIASVAFNDFKIKKHTHPVYDKNTLMYSLLSVILTLSITFALYWVWDLSSLLSVIIGMLVYIVFVIYKRPDLIHSMLFSGILLSILAIIALEIISFAQTQTTNQLWNQESLSGIMIFNSPIESIFFFFLLGIFFSSIWEMTFKVNLHKYSLEKK